MKKLSRVTISLPTDLLTAVEEKLAHEDENRSETFRRLIEQALKEAQRKADAEEYVRSYREDAMTDEEFEKEYGWTTALIGETLKELPWEPESEQR